jgi:site-specific DNA-methyltransferase (adenine-specific)
MNNLLVYGDCLKYLKEDNNEYQLIYIDPPFNLGHKQKRKRSLKGVVDDSLSELSYNDTFDDFEKFLLDRIELAIKLLTKTGSLFVHLNQKEVHYIKVALDRLLGRDKFMNEIIYSWDYGGKSKTKWSVKHDTILWYAMDPKNYTFNYDQMDRIPYKAPELVRNTCKTPEEAERKIAAGKICTSVWELGIVPTVSKENVKYPTQKPLKLLDRIIKVHSNEGDRVLDFFGGSGTTAVSAAKNGRSFTTVDQNIQAIELMKKRFDSYKIEYDYTVSGQKS